MNRKFNLWLGGLLVILVGMLLWGRSAMVICWDGLEVDEEMLQELCGISSEEYFSEDFDLDSCPQAVNAVQMVGGCETDWTSVILITGWIGGAYLLLSGIGFAVWWRVKKPSRQNSD